MSDEQKLQLQELDVREFKCIVNSEIGELGCGRECSVRLADHVRFGWVAIKCFIMAEGAQQKQRLEKKLQKEIQALQKAMNKHIIQIYGWVKWPGSMGLVMEYMAGGSLGQFVEDGSVRLPLKVILRIGCETSDGIACMHNLPNDQRMVHGDLKPENVLLSPRLHCKMGDFGCAQLIALTGCTMTSSRRPEKTDLTLAYAAPEKLNDFNNKPKKEQDTYSFGMLMYALLNGSPPFQHRSQESAFIEFIKRGERPKTGSIDKLKENLNNEDKQILETLQSIMKKCWQQDPSDRPSMIEVRDELQQLLCLQNENDILKEETKVVDTLSISIPNADGCELLPLHYFSPLHGTFLQGNVYNIYNMPDVRQAAIESGTAEFHHAEAGTKAAEQQERQQIAMSEADDLRSSTDTSTERSLKVDTKPISAKEKAGPSSAADIDSKQLIGRKPTLSEVFESSDRALPSDVQEAPSLLVNYKVLLNDQNYKEAKTMATKINSMIEGNTTATAKEVEEFGKKHREKKLFLESIAFFDAAFVMFEKLGKTEENLKWMTICVWEISETNEAMIGDDANMKMVIQNYTIPLMREKLRHTENTSSVREQFKCLQVCLVLHYIERSEYLVGEWKESEKTQRFALSQMKDLFKSDVTRYKLYGHLLHNLGTVCGRTSRFREAASFFKQAINVHKAATDFNDEEEKKRRIELNKNNLRFVQRKMN